MRNTKPQLETMLLVVSEIVKLYSEQNIVLKKANEKLDERNKALKLEGIKKYKKAVSIGDANGLLKNLGGTL